MRSVEDADVAEDVEDAEDAEDAAGVDIGSEAEMAGKAEQSQWRHRSRARPGEYLTARGKARKAVRGKKQAEGPGTPALMQMTMSGDEYFGRS